MSVGWKIIAMFSVAMVFAVVIGVSVPSPIHDLQRENRLLRGNIQTAIHVVGFMRDDIRALEARIASLEATRPNTQTEQERP